MNDISSALDDYSQARWRAALKEILARITGKPINLLSYDEVRQKLKAQAVIQRGVQDIPLNAIIGSVNRYQDFTRGFLPRHSVLRDRWARVATATVHIGLPPIEVYRIGETYFVKDGNHRVSVARQLGWTHIQAYVEELLTHVPFTPDTPPDELILKAEWAGFLEHTCLLDSRPQADLKLTAPGQYARLTEHIVNHQITLSQQLNRELSYDEAAIHWYDTVYLPAAQIIEETGILRDFPGRTVADLYLWMKEHQTALEDELGQEVHPFSVAHHLVDRYSHRPGRIIARLGRRIRRTFLVKRLETGPSPGQWRKERPAASSNARLFSDILVAVSGKEDGWCALVQALEIARREGSRLYGLHVLPDEAGKQSTQTLTIENEFIHRCMEAGVSGRMTYAVGDSAEMICERSRWNDLVVVNLTYPSASRPFAELSPGFRSLVKRCSRPLLAIPRRVSPLCHILLAYNGSLNSREGLYIATYLAGCWDLPLVVITVDEKNKVNPDTLAEAWHYLETHGIDATYVKVKGPVVQEILITSEERDCDLIIMGGLGAAPSLVGSPGSTVEQVLCEAQKPILICH